MKNNKQTSRSPAAVKYIKLIGFIGLIICSYHSPCASEDLGKDTVENSEANMTMLLEKIFEDENSAVLSTSIEQEKRKITQKGQLLKEALSLIAQWKNDNLPKIAPYIIKNANGDKKILAAWEIYKTTHDRLAAILSGYDNKFTISIGPKLNEEDIFISALKYISKEIQELNSKQALIKDKKVSINEYMESLKKSSFKSFFTFHKKEKIDAQILIVKLIDMLDYEINAVRTRINNLSDQQGEMLGKMLEERAHELPDVPSKVLGKWLDKSAQELPDVPKKQR